MTTSKSRAEGTPVQGGGNKGSDAGPPMATRTRLLAAAAELISRDGIDVSLADIAQHAGVTRMTLYRQIGKREQLLVDVLVYESTLASAELVEILEDRSRSFEERLVDVVLAVVRSVRTSPVLRLFVEQVTPTQVEGLDPGGAFISAVWAFLQPYFEDPTVRSSLRADPERTLDWTLRQILLQLVVRGRTNQSEKELRAELVTFFLPSILKSSSAPRNRSM